MKPENTPPQQKIRIVDLMAASLIIKKLMDRKAQSGTRAEREG